MFIVTGGGSGIGRALACALAERNKQVLIVGRRKKFLAQTATFSPLISYLVADILTDEGRQHLNTHLLDQSSIDGLIHNAGIIEPIVGIASITHAAWRKIMGTNLDAPLFLNQLLLDKLQQGRVLHIGSGVAYFPVAGWTGYCVSKAALAMLTRCWQLECPHVSFASVMPGIIDTEMQAFIREAWAMDTKKRDFFILMQQQGRLVSCETVAAFLSWLLLDLDKEQFISKEWDIYDTSHHPFWLIAPHKVPPLE